MPDQISAMLTTEEAATILNVSVRHVRRLVASGQLTGKPTGRDILINRAAIVGFKKKPKGRPKTNG